MIDFTKHKGPQRITLPDGTNIYMENGVLHRVDGPAISSPTHQEWFQNGQRYREDGATITYKKHPAPRGDVFVAANGERICEWYQEGKLILSDVVSEEAFKLHWYEENK